MVEPAGRVLVTGGARGLGRAVVEALAAGGHDVIFTYHSSSEAADSLCETLSARHAGQSVDARRVDLTDRDAVAGFVSDIEAGEPIYGLVHNAGQSYDSLAALMDRDRAETAMQVNFWAFTALAGPLSRTMTRARAGRIVAIGSVVGMRGSIGNAAYAASKSALLGYVRTLAMETARRGVTVNYVAPGFVDTEMLAPYAAHRERMEAQIPLGRFARADEIAAGVAFLVSPAASYVTGAVLPFDGGLSAAMPVHR